MGPDVPSTGSDDGCLVPRLTLGLAPEVHGQDEHGRPANEVGPGHSAIIASGLGGPTGNGTLRSPLLDDLALGRASN